MLESLLVKNLALIENAEINFTPGLNVLSGETGAGKSILIGSVLIALGAKVSKDMIRAGANEAYVELIFTPESEDTLKKLERLDIRPEDGQVIISKRITSSKSISRINGETYPASKVKEAATLLLDVHGQRDHQALLQPAKQLEIVDRFHSGEIVPLKNKVSESCRCWSELKKSLEEYRLDEDERLRRIDILKFEIDELEEAGISPGEEAGLMEEWKVLSSREQLFKAYRAISDLTGYESGACDLLSKAQQEALSISELEARAKDIYDQLIDAEAILSDTSHQLKDIISSMEDDERDPSQIEERLEVIRHLMQKYRCDEEGLLKLLENKHEELERYSDFQARREKLEKECSEAYRVLKELSGRLTEARKNSAAELAIQLKTALAELNFIDVKFEIRINASENYTQNGCDNAQFYISTNPGEPIKPIAAVASGGELSRIMLAIKSVMAKSEEIETLIFDEIDTGISGRTAAKVADRLCVIARESQVICISHLAQIVSMADTHFLIEKVSKGDTTATHIQQLTGDESILELARLLGGSEITRSVIDTAREMKAIADKSKTIKQFKS